MAARRQSGKHRKKIEKGDAQKKKKKKKKKKNGISA